MKLTFEEWKNQYSVPSQDGQMAEDFKNFHGLNLHEEIGKMLLTEYDQYVQRAESEIE